MFSFGSSFIFLIWILTVNFSLHPVLSGESFVLGFLSLCFLLLLLVPSQVTAQRNASSTEAPSWYLNPPKGPGLVKAGQANDTTGAIINALGNMTQELDPNIQRKQLQYKEDLNQQLTRIISQFDFDTVTVKSMEEFYSDLVNNRDHSGLNQRIVKVVFNRGDTRCLYRYYNEEVQGEINNVVVREPETCSGDLLVDVLQRAGVSLVRSRENIVRHYVLLSYLPSRKVTEADTGLRSDTSYRKNSSSGTDSGTTPER